MDVLNILGVGLNNILYLFVDRKDPGILIFLIPGLILLGLILGGIFIYTMTGKSYFKGMAGGIKQAEKNQEMINTIRAKLIYNNVFSGRVLGSEWSEKEWSKKTNNYNISFNEFRNKYANPTYNVKNGIWINIPLTKSELIYRMQNNIYI